MELRMLEELIDKIRLSFYGLERQKIDNLWNSYKVALVAWQVAFNKASSDAEEQKRISIQVCRATDSFMSSLKAYLSKDDQYHNKILGELIRKVRQRQSQLKGSSFLEAYSNTHINSAGQLLNQVI